MRAIAVLFVFAFHTGAPFAHGGFVGVDVFFVLSGFLITGILHREIVDTGSLRLGRFYRRRLLRLMPALALLVGVFYAVSGDSVQALRAILYLNDIMPPVIDSLHHTWSLAVEEHYYLLWPVLLLLIMRLAPRHALAICTGLWLVSLAWRYTEIGTQGAWLTSHRFDVRLGGLLLGSTLALFVADGRRIGRSGMLGFIFALLTIEFLPMLGPNSRIGLGLAMPLGETMTAFAIISIVQGEQAFRFLEARPLRFLGEISYGFYLFHTPLTLWMLTHDVPWWIIALTVFPLAIIMASLSYFFIERPIRYWDRPWRRRPEKLRLPAAERPVAEEAS